MFEIEFYQFNHRYTTIRCTGELSVLKQLKNFRSCGNRLFMHKTIAGAYAIVNYTL